MIILLRLIVAHLVGDFLLQPSSWVLSKRKKKLSSKYLYFHALIHGGTTYLFLGDWGNWYIPLFIAVTHLLIDIWKLNCKDNTKNFLLDQFFHILMIVISWLYLTGQIRYLGEIATAYLSQKDMWVLLIGYMVVVWPMRFIIALATNHWKQEIQNEGLINAGQWIGQIERILILTFVIINKFEAIGFLITAKSIFRFSEINKERKEAEYILIGTLLSFALSIIWGIFLNYLLTK